MQQCDMVANVINDGHRVHILSVLYRLCALLYQLVEQGVLHQDQQVLCYAPHTRLGQPASRSTLTEQFYQQRHTRHC